MKILCFGFRYSIAWRADVSPFGAEFKNSLRRVLTPTQFRVWVLEPSLGKSEFIFGFTVDRICLRWKHKPINIVTLLSFGPPSY